MTGLLERVRFFGGEGGAGSPDDTAELPALDLGPDALEPDPQPAPDTRKRVKSAASASTAAKQTRVGGKFVSSAKQRQNMAEELDSYAKMLALMWSMSDEHCAGVLNDTSAAITQDLANLLARSEWVMDKFATTSLFADCFKLLHHLWPLLRAIYQHHGPGRPTEPDDGHEEVTVSEVDPVTYGPWRPQNVV